VSLTSFPVPARLAGVGAAMLLSFTLLNASDSLSTKALPVKQIDRENNAEPSTHGSPRELNLSLRPPVRPPEPREYVRPPVIIAPADPTVKTNKNNSEQSTPVVPENLAPLPVVPSDKDLQQKAADNSRPTSEAPLKTAKEAALHSELPPFEDVSQIQSRLHDLGFLSFSPTGVWDGRSRDALQDFKVVNRLGSDGAWTVRAGEALVSPASIRASQSFIGRWCGVKREPPLLINSRRASSSTGVCEFANFESAKGEWRVKAVCTEYGRSWTVNIRFVSRGSKLVWWSSVSGTASYLRCR
jgi:hypothetical protein